MSIAGAMDGKRRAEGGADGIVSLLLTKDLVTTTEIHGEPKAKNQVQFFEGVLSR
ncbi:MAG: hypothetical protein AABY87_07280 [bacterium]